MYRIKGVECRKLFVTFMKIFKNVFILAYQYAIISRSLPSFLCPFIYAIYLLFGRFNYFIIVIYTNLF